jgi:CRISPR/Cas system-associated exonuclease Cas4 (RecB family)
MPLPIDFQFSQNNLQSFINCPRQFELRYILRQDWPAVQSVPVLEQERQMKLGYQFHHMLHQYLSGMSPDSISKMISDLDLMRWWNSFLVHSPVRQLPKPQYPEYYLIAPFAGFRLVAKYDLLAVDPGNHAVIFDWKTSRTTPNTAYLKQRMQSRLYPFLLSLAGKNLNQGIPLSPEQIEMIYWFPEYPKSFVSIQYSSSQYQKHHDEIQALISEILALEDAEGIFPQTNDESHCLYCRYRSLCDRGKKAGEWQHNGLDTLPDDEIMFDFDFDQIGEISF